MTNISPESHSARIRKIPLLSHSSHIKRKKSKKDKFENGMRLVMKISPNLASDCPASEIFQKAGHKDFCLKGA